MDILNDNQMEHKRLIWYGHAQRQPNGTQDINLVWTYSTTTKWNT